MVTERAADVSPEHPESLAIARGWLAYARSSSPASAAFTLAAEVQQLYGRPRPMKGRRQADPERALIDYALAFANGDTDDAPMRQAIAQGQAREVANGEPTGTSADELLGRYVRAVADKRQERRALLASVMAAPLSAAYRLGPEIAAGLSGIWTLPEWRGGKLTHHLVVLDPPAFDALVSVLLVDKEKPFGRALRQCQRPDCEHFFLMPKQSGRPQQLYCSVECRLTQHERGAAERMRKLRERRKRGARRGKAK